MRYWIFILSFVAFIIVIGGLGRVLYNQGYVDGVKWAQAELLLTMEEKQP